jgi:ferrous iron transport protein B
MDFIDESFLAMSEYVKDVFPLGMLSDLISEGIIPGIGGIVIFDPKIAFLFLFISFLKKRFI